MKIVLPSLDDCRVLLCNDDGYEGPGLAVLKRAVESFSDDVWVIAPAANQSALGRSYSIAREVKGRRIEERGFAVEGTPVDCVILGLNGLIPGRRPDLVLSGVNEGTNLAEDIAASGTVGACLEAVDQGVPAIAFSQVGTYPTPEHGSWTAAESFLPRILSGLVASLSEDRPVLNVNFPLLNEPGELRGAVAALAGRRSGPVTIERRDEGDGDDFIYYYDLLREDRAAYPDCDLDLALRGYITITPLNRDPTNAASIDSLNERISRLEDDLLKG